MTLGWLALFGVAGATPVLSIQGPPVGGAPVELRVEGMPPGSRIHLLGALRDGPGACPPQLAPACLDLADPVRRLRTLDADGLGRARVDVVLPTGRPELFTQAVALDPAGALVSNALRIAPALPDDDDDGDGLVNLDEVLLFGTDPFSADTDGGGRDDGAEVDLGRDPVDPVDDVLSLADGLSGVDLTMTMSVRFLPSALALCPALGLDCSDCTGTWVGEGTLEASDGVETRYAGAYLQTGSTCPPFAPAVGPTTMTDLIWAGATPAFHTFDWSGGDLVQWVAHADRATDEPVPDPLAAGQWWIAWAVQPTLDPTTLTARGVEVDVTDLGPTLGLPAFEVAFSWEVDFAFEGL